MKKEYSAPKVTIYGDARDITKNNDPAANLLDAAFPSGTPKDQLTWGDNLS